MAERDLVVFIVLGMELEQEGETVRANIGWREDKRCEKREINWLKWQSITRTTVCSRLCSSILCTCLFGVTKTLMQCSPSRLLLVIPALRLNPCSVENPIYEIEYWCIVILHMLCFIIIFLISSVFAFHSIVPLLFPMASFVSFSWRAVCVSA